MDWKNIDYRTILSEAEVQAARNKTIDQILAEGLHTIIEIAKDNGLTDDETDAVVRRVLDERVRSRFKVLK